MFLRLAALALISVTVAPGLAIAADFDPQQATETYLATVSGAARAKSDAYFEGGYALDAISAALNIVVALFILLTGRSRRMRDFAERIVGVRGIQVVIYTAIFLLLTTILTLPFDFYRGFVREHEYGMSNQDLAGWVQDYAIAATLNIILLSLFAATFYAVIRRSPRNWWLWGTGVAIAFAALAIMIAPVYISPLFNTYKPMAEGQLKSEILSLARANGVPVDNVYQFDASKQTKRISANVSGLFGTIRISLNDNLLNRATPAEVKAVMGHELGHYVLNHIQKLLLMLSIYFAIAMAVVSVLFGAFVRRPGARLGIRDQADPAGMPALIAVATLVFYLGTPVFNTMIRVQEAEADIFGLNSAREPDAFATIALKLAEYRKLDPEPWEEMIFYDHPSGRSRISMAMQWKAEHLNDASPAPIAPAVDPPHEASSGP